MPRKNLKPKDIDKKYDKMTIKEIKELYNTGSKEEIDDYISYLTRKTHQAREIFNNRKKQHEDIDQINEEWKEKAKKNNIIIHDVIKEEEKVLDKLVLNDDEMEDVLDKIEKEENENFVPAPSMKKSASVDKDSLKKVYKEFSQKYKINLDKTIEKLILTTKEAGSNTIFTRYKGPKKYFTQVVDDNKKDKFYKSYKAVYKNNLVKVLTHVTKNQTLKLNPKTIARFTETYDYLVRHAINNKTNIMPPSLGGISIKEYNQMISNMFEVRYAPDGLFNGLFALEDRRIKKFTKKEWRNLLDNAHGLFADVLKNSKVEPNEQVRTETAMKSVAKIYNGIKKVNDLHSGFWYKLFHKQQYEEEQRFMTSIKLTCMNVFKEGKNKLTSHDFDVYMDQRMSFKPTILVTLDNNLSAFQKIKTTEGLQNIKEDQAEYANEKNVSKNQINIINEDVKEIKDLNKDNTNDVRKPIDVSDVKENTNNNNTINTINVVNSEKELTK